MGTAREYHTATLLDFGSALTNGKVLVTGGLGINKQALADAELFDPKSGTFTQTKGPMETARAYHTATLLNDGTILVAGGFDGSGLSLASAELFDPATGTFTPTKHSMETGRADHTATLLDDGTVLIAGGSDGSTALLTTAEIFDPATGTFTPAKGNMAVGRIFHTATLLDHGSALTNGKVLVAGGGTGATAAAELFDPSSGTFAATGSMEFDRRAHTATLLNDGRVLVTGGGAPSSNPNSGSSASAELFDPATGLFTPTKVDMTTKRTNHRAILLNDGTVLVAGGVTAHACLPRNTCTTYLAAAELFDPANGSFTLTGEMTTPRAYHTATILKDGTVLVTGGDNRGGPLATAELYQ
jgi:N-acetylneuraminic acid mutarotase